MCPELAGPVTLRIVVHGRVQGVGFRWSCREEALRLGVAGFVRNLPDGTVEVVAEGPGEQVDRLLDWCRRGPRHANVTSVEVRADEPRRQTTFRVV